MSNLSLIENMKRFILLFSLICSTCVASFGQGVFKKIANHICKCSTKNEYNLQEPFPTCAQEALEKYNDQLLKEYNVESSSEIDRGDVILQVSTILTKTCDYRSESMQDPTQEKLRPFEVNHNNNCTSIQLGEYFYLVPNYKNDSFDTVFASISKDEYLEKMDGGKTYSRLKVKWKNSCTMQLTFIESTNKEKALLSKKGEKYTYQIIHISDDFIILELELKIEKMRFQFFKIP